MEEAAVFRSSKRRKFARAQHVQSPESTSVALPAPAEGEATHADGDETQVENGAEVDIANLIRARKQHRKPAAGVQFSNSDSTRKTNEDNSNSPVAKADESVDKPIDITNRFIGSTGQVVNVDRHMIAFIDAEMAKRRNELISSSDNPQRGGDEESRKTLSTPAEGNIWPVKMPPSNHPSSARQLSEVDLGSSAHDSNIARTQAALERAKAGQAPVEEEPKPQRPRKPRIGRDGKPMKPPPRKRRNSEDIARDALVEQVLHENRLDIYDADDLEQRRNPENRGQEVDDSDADERLAKQFRQEFFDAMAERHHRNKTSSQPKGPGAGTESKGPKLGGSRSARAKMAQMQQQQQQHGQVSGKK
ncbi:uncharacterized protein Z518_04007 [Rhinocladiella mackenziei CBS 650.93]|uniref:Uncharacterized protein n=1 Tax=Rhinocladiella mackenziei CBS 650.93 TaxID=1442369 RepID=A0A0D2H6N1_9EURO|nr:uncharacterized protein Z518_04007 [Rhinocladiella mackenziei CBS 650.93]KIX06033.1 hypothetical protein Z518_04007 [Rhinocladiella mackenziei CBS 650.93]